MGYFLISPLRRWLQEPERILEPYIKPGMTVLDIGSGMGFFSLPMAEMVGQEGNVVCIDLQERMLKTLKKRAEKAGLIDRMKLWKCPKDTLVLDNLNGRVNFAIAFAVVHEVPDPSSFFREVYDSLSKGGTLLLAEPKGRVSQADFNREVDGAMSAGFSAIKSVFIKKSYATLFEKK